MTVPAHRLVRLYRDVLHHILDTGYEGGRRANFEEATGKTHRFMDYLAVQIDEMDNDAGAVIRDTLGTLRHTFDYALFFSTFTRDANPEVFALGDVLDTPGGPKADVLADALEAMFTAA